MSTSVSEQPRRRARRGLEISLLLLVAVIAAVLAVGSMQVRRAQQERAAVRSLWRLGALVLFEGEEEYVNPPLAPREWDAELERSWLDDLFAASPTHVHFVRFGRSVGGPEPVVDDDDIPELIDIVRALPAIKQVTLDRNITPAGKARLENALPEVRFVMPPSIP